MSAAQADLLIPYLLFPHVHHSLLLLALLIDYLFCRGDVLNTTVLVVSLILIIGLHKYLN